MDSNVTLSYSCDDCNDDFDCEVCDLSFWYNTSYDSMTMPNVDIVIKTIGMNVYWLNYLIRVMICKICQSGKLTQQDFLGHIYI